MPTCGPFPLLSPCRALGTPATAGVGLPLCSQVGHFCFCPRVEHLGSPRRQGLGSHCAYMWATSYFVPRYEALGIPEPGRVR